MSHDRNALITAYRMMTNCTEIEANQVVRAVESDYAEKQNAELLKALDEADGRQVQEIAEARSACVWLAQIHGHYGPGGSILAHFQAGQYDEVIALIQTREQRRLSRTGPAIIRIVAVEKNHVRLDCGDEETAHVWVSVVTWSGRRAYLTGASPFLNVLRAESGTENAPADLLGECFIAELPLEPPPAMPEPAEYLEWPGLKLADSLDEIKKRLGIS